MCPYVGCLLCETAVIGTILTAGSWPINRPLEQKIKNFKNLDCFDLVFAVVHGHPSAGGHDQNYYFCLLRMTAHTSQEDRML